jgi:bidirectional [NiFe] hydrogenase diaphorase subunit
MPQKKISIRVDGELVNASEGQTVLDAARAAGRSIPTLCHLDGLDDVGACRLCLVEVSGSGRLVPACTTPAQHGMSVATNTPQLTAYRRMIVELLLAERNHICAVCVSNGHCELQTLASELGVRSVRYRYSFPKLALDLTHDRFVLDQNRCVLCGRCVRACADIEGAHVWDFTSRGIFTRIVADLADPWSAASACTGCGKCVEVCPTGAIAEKGKAVEEMVKRGSRVSRNVARKELGA